MRRLAIETAGPAASVALFDGETLLAFVQEETARGTAERLIAMIHQLKPREIEEILVDVGPGSFTGLRVGLAAAIGLGIGWSVPVRGFGATALVAARALAEGVSTARLLAVNEGGHGQFFVQPFTTDPLHGESEALSLRPEAIIPSGRLIVGNAAAKFGGTDIPLDARFAMHLPIALRTLPPVPIYGRAPDARPPRMTPLVIAEAKADEVGGVVDLMRRAFDPLYGEAWTLSQLAGVLAMPGSRLTVARRRNRLLGFALIRTVLDECELMLIAVDPTARRVGIAAALMADIATAACTAGIRKLHLEVRRGNDATQLYRAHGFIKAGERLHYYRGPAGQVFDAETYVLTLSPEE